MAPWGRHRRWPATAPPHHGDAGTRTVAWRDYPVEPREYLGRSTLPFHRLGRPVDVLAQLLQAEVRVVSVETLLNIGGGIVRCAADAGSFCAASAWYWSWQHARRRSPTSAFHQPVQRCYPSATHLRAEASGFFLQRLPDAFAASAACATPASDGSSIDELTGTRAVAHERLHHRAEASISGSVWRWWQRCLLPAHDQRRSARSLLHAPRLRFKCTWLRA